MWGAVGTAPIVYFIQAGPGGPIKIGYSSRSGAARLRENQTAQAETLILLAEARGTREDEAALHGQFNHRRVRGEWFENCTEIQDLIAYLQDGGTLRSYLG